MQTLNKIPQRVLRLLDSDATRYAIVVHQREYAGWNPAGGANASGPLFIKAAIVQVDDAFAVAVLPGAHRIDCLRLRTALGAEEVARAPELIVREIFSDCEAGAEPPLGNLYGLPVYVSAPIVENERIAFNAGTHDCAIEMRYADFARLTQARVLTFSVEAAS